MKIHTERTQIKLLSVEKTTMINGIQDVLLQTNEGDISCMYHSTPKGSGAILWVGGVAGGLTGPAGGVYPRLANVMVRDNLASLRLNYRYPNHLEECVLDVLQGIEYLKSINRSRIVLVGHSFGGAVVIGAGALSESVVGVVAMSSQTHGTSVVNKISPRPLLLLHGAEDEILSDSCSADLYKRAEEPKHLIIYPGCKHGLDYCKDLLDSDLRYWIRNILVVQ